MLTYNVTISVPQVGAVSALTGGSKNLDFTASSSECANNTLTGGLTCSVNVSFSPTFAGSRPGALEFVDSSENNQATTLVYGKGMGPQVAFRASQFSNAIVFILTFRILT